MHLVLLSILLHTLLIYLPIYAASHSFSRIMTAVLIYQATSCHVPQASNLQNQSRGTSKFHTMPAGLLAAVIMSAWLSEHHGMKLYMRVDLWFYIFVISKVNGTSVISYTFRHIYPSRIIFRYSLNRKICGPLRQCESFREKYLALTGN